MFQGPIDLAVLRFPGNQFRGEIIPALERLVSTDVIQIIDLIFLNREPDGTTIVLELNDLDEDQYAVWDSLVGSLSGLLSSEDATALAHMVEPGSSAALIVYENSWASELASAIRRAGGELVLSERIPRAVIDELRSYSGAGLTQ
jgi:hypothetical protein